MALTSYPFETQSTTETQYSLLFRQAVDTGVVGNFDGDGFRVSTDGSGLDVQVAAGFALVRGHAVDNNGPVTLTLDAASASPRIDLVVLRLDPTANSIVLTVKKGDASATPSAPVLTQTDTGIYEIALAALTVPSGALNIVPANVEDRRLYSGDQVGVWTTGRRPTDIAVGKIGYNVALGLYEGWSGSQWVPVGGGKKKVVVPHTFTLTGQVATASGDDYYIPGFYVPLPAGQAVKIVRTRARINSGTSVSYELMANGIAIAGSSHTATTSQSSSTLVNFPVTSEGVEVSLRITGFVGTPKNLNVTVWLEYEV